MYKVLSAQAIRGQLVLGVEIQEPHDFGWRGRTIEVAENPDRRLTICGGRIVFDSEDRVTSRRILICDAIDFPPNELIGQQLRPSPLT